MDKTNRQTMATLMNRHMFAQVVDGAGNPLQNNEIPLYTPIYSWMGEYMVREINKFAGDEELTIRLNTPGGEVMTGWAVISRLADRQGPLRVFVDGMAYSMGAFMCLYTDNVVASENAEFMFHKAAYSSYYEPDEQELESLKRINATFKKKMQERLNDSAKAKEVINKVFEADTRRDVYLTAKEAKAIGLVKEVRKLDTSVQAFMEDQAKLVAMYGKEKKPTAEEVPPVIKEPTQKPTADNNHNKNKKMTKAEILAQYPQAAAELMADGAAQERDRVESFLPYMDVASEAVKEGIASGKKMTEAQRTELTIALVKGVNLEAEKDPNENPQPVATPSAQKTETAEPQATVDGLEAAFAKRGLKIGGTK